MGGDKPISINVHSKQKNFAEPYLYTYQVTIVSKTSVTTTHYVLASRLYSEQTNTFSCYEVQGQASRTFTGPCLFSHPCFMNTLRVAVKATN